MPNPLRVLHLEDSARDAEMIRHKLDAEAIFCDIVRVSTKDGFEAALSEHLFDLILCDYTLPRYDGISALQYAQQTRPDVPVILISGTVGEEEAVRCLHLGATDYLLKDRLERLGSAVERAIRAAETRCTRRLTEEKLRQSEQLNRSLVEHLPQRVFVKDLNSNYVFCNSGYARDLGLEPGQILGRDDFAFFSRERAEGNRADDRQVMTDGNIKARDERHTVAEKEQWIHIVKIPYRNEQGEIIGVLGLLEDISERKQAEQALRAAEERTRFALQAAKIGIWDLDVPTGRIQWSELLEGHYGLKPGTLGGTFEAFIERIHPDDRTSVLETVGKAMKAGADFSVLNRSIWPDGTVRWLSGAGRILLGEHGEPVRAVCISQDVTARMQADETRARLAAIVDSSDDAIVSMAPDETILTWNTGAERLLGYTANEVIGRRRGPIVPIGKVAELAAIMERTARGEPGETFETQRRRKDGSIVDVSLTISPMTDSTGRVTGACTIARDITSRIEAAAELTRLNHEIQLQRMRVFKATIRTVQDIVNNLLNTFQLVRFEGEGQLPDELLALVDQMIDEAGVKLKTLGDLETVNEKEMIIGMGIDYPGAGS
jgi:PAS domain S-box-containing protein